MHIYGVVHVFGNIIGPATGQVPKLLMCSWSVPFPFPWFSGGCVFSSCWMHFDVALCYRGLSPCVLICNLRAQVSPIVPMAWSTYICIYC
jgi:hypothetical protein